MLVLPLSPRFRSAGSLHSLVLEFVKSQVKELILCRLLPGQLTQYWHGACVLGVAGGEVIGVSAEGAIVLLIAVELVRLGLVE